MEKKEVQKNILELVLKNAFQRANRTRATKKEGASEKAKGRADNF